MKKLVVAPIHYFYTDLKRPLPREIKLEGDYLIKEFDKSFLEPVFEFFHESFSEHDKKELHNCRFAIYHDYSSNDSSQIPDSIISDVNRIVQTLRVVRPTRAIAEMLNFEFREGKAVPLQVIHKPLTVVSLTHKELGSQHFKESDAKLIRNYWEQIKYLSDNFEGKYHKILNGLFFFEIGHHIHLYKPRLVNFVTCLESLFNTSSQEVGYTLRIRCSNFLEKNSSKKLSLTKELKDIYSLRSLFVHGQGAPKKLLKDIDRQMRLLLATEDIVRKCLKRVFDGNLVNLFGDIEKLNVEFEKLELGLPSRLQ